MQLCTLFVPERSEEEIYTTREAKFTGLRAQNLTTIHKTENFTLIKVIFSIL